MEESFLRIVPRALTYLYKQGTKGHWADARTTAEVVLALLASGETLQAPHFRYACEYLVTCFVKESEGGSWGSELWDTSMAIRALSACYSNGKKVVDQAFEWVWSKTFPDGSADGEPWDTLFVCLAAIESGRAEGLILHNCVEWLCTIQNNDGLLISPHYTGIFCEVIGGILGVDLPSHLRQRYRDAAVQALQALWDRYNPSTLWGRNTWTNAYIIDGLMALRHREFLKEYDSVLMWFEAEQNDQGAWDDPVRTAIVVKSLCHLKFAYELDKCIARPLQDLSLDLYSRSMQSEIAGAIQRRTSKAAIVRSHKLIEKDEMGNRIITLTPEREIYLGLVTVLLSLIWATLTNWPLLKRLLHL